MLLHPYPDKNYVAKFIRYLKIWLLIGFLLGLFTMIYIILTPGAEVEAKKLSFNDIMGYTKEVARCLRNINSISWDSNQEPDLAYYNVYRGKLDKKELIEWTFLGNTEQSNDKRLSYQLGKEDRQNLYFYRVTAVDISGIESKPSKSISCLKT